MQSEYRSCSLVVYLKRNSHIESIHRVHVAVSDMKGRLLMYSGNPQFQTFIRSSLKPFQAIPFISSGAADKIESGKESIAICTGSHSGSAKHAREAFKILWKSEIETTQLQCPTSKEKPSPLQHNCSGKHAGFLSTCKKMRWPLEGYLTTRHPLQLEIKRIVSDLLCIPLEELVTATDDCGAPTLSLPLSQMSTLYAHLSGSKNAELERICRAMIGCPELIAGDGKFDTELIKRAHGQVISKGGAEGIQCLGRMGEGIGIAIKVEDGSRRAKHAVALHLLSQLEWITPIAVQELESKVLKVSQDLKLEVDGKLKFKET